MHKYADGDEAKDMFELQFVMHVTLKNNVLACRMRKGNIM